MARSTPVLLSTLAILGSACASYIDKPYQRIQVETPGARNAECILKTGGTKAIAHPPQKVTIRNNDEPLKVTCTAPGNRVRHASYKASQAESAKYNIANGYAPGMYYDHVERSLYTYPEKIVVDFKGVKERANPLPDYQNATAPSPTEAEIENFGPGRSLQSWDEMQTSSDRQPDSGNKSKDRKDGLGTPTPLPEKKDTTNAPSFEQDAKDDASSGSSQTESQANMPQQSSNGQDAATESSDETDSDEGGRSARAVNPASLPAPTQSSSPSSPSSSSLQDQDDGQSTASSFEERARQQGRNANSTQTQSGDSSGESPTQLY